MALCVADIVRWNPEAVRDVFNAARNRYEASRFAAEELGSLPAFQTWGGDAADAAREAVGKTRADLDSHGAEALAVAQAADQAADGIEDVSAGWPTCGSRPPACTCKSTSSPTR